MKEKTRYLVADLLAVVPHPAHVHQHISDPRLVNGDAEFQAPSGHQTAGTIESYRLESENKAFAFQNCPPFPSLPLHLHRGIKRAAAASELLAVVCDAVLLNRLVFDRQAAVHGYLRHRRCEEQRVRSVERTRCLGCLQADKIRS